MENCEHYEVCGLDSRPGGDKCILHAKDPDKDTGQFRSAIAEHRKTAKDFRHIVFPEEINIREEFPDGVDFSHATFEDRTSFRGADFGEDARFEETIFKKAVIFARTSFEKAYFDQTDFRKGASFEGARIIDSYFCDTKFRQSSRFCRAVFEFTTFKNCFIESGEFSDADFETATFEGVDFRDSIEEAAFHGSTLIQVDFRDCDFIGEADFYDTNLKNVNLQGSTFEDKVTFQDAVFSGKAIFREARFEGDGIFLGAFGPEDDTQLDFIDFSDADFHGKAVFAGDNEEKRAFARARVRFTEVRQFPEADLQFRYADFSRCRFLRTDVRKIDFTAVTWCDEFSVDGWFTRDWFRRNEWLRRVGLYDEIHEEKRSETERWHEIERLYRQLKRNYEERGDFPRGGDFHIGEKEARRRNPETRWGPWFLLTAYRALSKYGERALPATFWLLGLVPTLALFYFLLGASTCTLCDPVSYPEALLSSLEVTFYPVRPAGFQDFWPQLLSIIQRVASPIIIALLALALRQRVKR